MDWHIRLQKLNQQAVLEACSMQEELTKETLISSGKVIQINFPLSLLSLDHITYHISIYSKLLSHKTGEVGF